MAEVEEGEAATFPRLQELDGNSNARRGRTRERPWRSCGGEAEPEQSAKKCKKRKKMEVMGAEMTEEEAMTKRRNAHAGVRGR